MGEGPKIINLQELIQRELFLGKLRLPVRCTMRYRCSSLPVNVEFCMFASQKEEYTGCEHFNAALAMHTLPSEVLCREGEYCRFIGQRDPNCKNYWGSGECGTAFKGKIPEEAAAS